MASGFFRYRWIIALTILIALTIDSATAQGQIEQPGESVGAEERVEGFRGFSIPVQIINDGNSDAVRDGLAAQDLEAQKRMADATVAMNDANQSMDLTAKWSLGLVAVSTLLLIGTLLLTLDANRSARRAVNVTEEIGSKQLRPWVLCKDVRVWPRSDIIFQEGSPPRPGCDIFLTWTVVGQSPASSVSIQGEFRIIDQDEVFPTFEFNKSLGNSTIGINIEQNSRKISLAEELVSELQRGTKQLIVSGRVDYAGPLNRGSHFHTEVTFRIKWLGSFKRNGETHPLMTWEIEGHQNSLS